MPGAESPTDVGGVILGYRFAAIPEWVLYHPELSGDDVRVFGVLARYGSDSRPSLKTIAGVIGKSRDTAKRCVHKLAEVGALSIEVRFSEGVQLPNRYHLAGDGPLADPGGEGTGAPGRGTGAPGGRGTGAPGVGAPVHPKREQYNESNNSKKEIPPTPHHDSDADHDTVSPPLAPTCVVDEDRKPEEDPDFLDFWSTYPRKEGKPKARQAFRAARKRASRDEILSGLRAWLPYWRSRESQFTPHASTWLNRDGWDDRPPNAGQAPRYMNGARMQDPVPRDRPMRSRVINGVRMQDGVW